MYADSGVGSSRPGISQEKSGSFLKKRTKKRLVLEPGSVAAWREFGWGYGTDSTAGCGIREVGISSCHFRDSS
jgi:hypothetical protein